MIDLAGLFSDLGIIGGATMSDNFYDFYKGIIWIDDTITNTQYEFFKKINKSRYDFFKEYGNEYDFYKNIDDERIYDFYTFYKHAGEYIHGGPLGSDWILITGHWEDEGFWRDEEVWVD